MQDKIPHEVPAAVAGLTPIQQARVDDTRELLAALDGGRETTVAHALASYERVSQILGTPGTDRRRQLIAENPYPEALGHAMAQIRELLAVIDGLTGGAK